MKVNLSVIGKFHTFDLARELHARGMLGTLYTGYPRFKLVAEGLPQEKINTFPYFHGAYMAYPYKDSLPRSVVKKWEYLARTSLDNHVARNIDNCDVFVGLSSSALKTGEQVKRSGARYVCDRGSSHIRYQNALLSEEYALWGEQFEGVDPRVIAREEMEYDVADCITVPSTFTYRSFIKEGIPADKLRKLPYGVNLVKFSKTCTPATGQFDVLFVGGMNLRKGVQYLVDAFRKLQHQKKSLTFAGAPSQDLINILRKSGLWIEDAKILGHVPQSELKNLMSRSHAMVLPSIEEGLAMVQAQAMACGCPVIASENTGAEDLFDDGIEGFIVPIRDPAAIAERLQYLADHPDERDAMGERAFAKVQSLGGWKSYGDQAVAIYKSLLV
jgi:glycosyltransferase involved in cell wall biosynthesis